MTTIDVDLTDESEDDEDLSDEERYCKDEGFPEDVANALLALQDRPYRLNDAYAEWNSWGERYDSDFIEAVEQITGDTCVQCEDCEEMFWWIDTTDIGDKRVCDDSCLREYVRCDGCSDYKESSETTTIGGSEYCESCVERNFTWCEECEEYYPDDDNHNHGCDCVAPHFRFRFPANGHGTIDQDERLTVELPKGTISDEGLKQIQRLVSGAPGMQYSKHIVGIVISEIGPQWQAKRGNFTRRLSSGLHKHGIKLDPKTVSEVGNLARQHSSDEQSWDIEVTRDLNQDAAAFYHEGSCWFSDGSYGESRCCLKQWGGVALRTFSSFGSRVTGRAWIQPLNEDMEPTHDAVNAHAYVVYNGYGDLDGYVAARIVAHLSGKTYKKIAFDAENQFVNSDVGYLVADSETCEAKDDLYLDYSPHYTHDAGSVRRAA